MVYPVYRTFTQTTPSPGTYLVVYAAGVPGKLVFLDLALGTVMLTYPVDANSAKILISTDGKFYFACDNNNFQVVNLQTGYETGFSQGPSPNPVIFTDMCIAIDGTSVYIVDYANLVLFKVTNPTNNSIVITTPITGLPYGADSVAVANIGGTEYILIGVQGALKVYADNGTLLGTFTVAVPGGPPRDLTVWSVCMLPDNVHGYYIADNTAVPFELAGFTSGTPLALPPGITHQGRSCVTLDGSLMYVPLLGPVAVIDTITNSILTNIVMPAQFVGSLPAQCVLTPDGTQVIVSSLAAGGASPVTNNIAVISTETQAVTKLMSTGTLSPDNVAVAPLVIAGTTGIVANSGVPTPRQIAQVPSDDQWNITVQLNGQTDGTGMFTVISGARIIGTAIIGAVVGPFTAYRGDIISVGVAQAPLGFVATITGNGYTHDDLTPPVYVATPSL